ncbi:MAG: hypothetical protein JNK46_00745 [Methylobacteriaceae bacterium]|nr:hypothetical protein [Methylobacteriaceae bacterium]
MTLKQQAIDLLKGSPVSRIRYKFLVAGTPITVNRACFTTVAEKIDNGHITVQTGNTGDAAATYMGSTNTITTPPLTGRFAQGNFVHESLHAYFDMARSGVPALDDEAACYITEVLYVRMMGLREQHWSSPSRLAAKPIVTGILQAYMRGVREPEVNFTQWLALRDVIRNRPIYVNGPAGTGGSYTQDG